MILQRLVLKNLGTFGGEHAIDLAPVSEDRPIVLIGGLNGAGKTTILEAIQLAFYGPRANRSRRTGSYEGYLRSLIHYGVPAAEGAGVELSFTANQEGKEHSYWLSRSWKSAGASLREILIVRVDGKFDQTLGTTWNEQVETFLPRGIAGLFFFDGEQIEALADLDNSRQVLGTALSALLGLDLVERLSVDLAILRRNHRRKGLSDGIRRELEAQQHKLGSARQLEQSAREAVAARRAEAERLDAVALKALDAYRKAGGDLADRREVAEREGEAARISLAERDGEIRHELAGIAPLLQVSALLDQLSRQAHAEAEARRNRLICDVLVGRDQELLGTLQAQEVDKGALEAVQVFLAADQERRFQSTNARQIALLTDPERLDALILALPETRARIRTGLVSRAETRERVIRAERVLSAIPDETVLAPLRQRLDEANREAGIAHATLALAEDSLQSASHSVAQAQAALDAAVDGTLLVADEARLVTHVDRVQDTLDRLRITATNSHLHRICTLIMEALGMLLRKERLITDLAIDPDAYTLTLTGADGQEVEAADLSAGERQLLAVALLWGLARASGQPLPVVIDTPLGRLDGAHRRHLLERYFPQASHQVILLSTDTEIDEAAYATVARYVGRAYRLEFDPKANATVVVEGYFWGHP